MKKNAIFAATMLILVAMVSCSRTEMETTELQGDDATMELQASPRFLKAMQTARDAAGLLDSEPATRSEQDRQIDENEIKFIVADNSTRSESESDTLMYVFNYMDNAGFAVVSAVGESGEMLAVTEQGHFNSMEEIENEGFRIFMEAATVYTDSLRWAETESTRFEPPTGPGFVDDFMIVTDSVVIANCPPLVSVRWGQSLPYNYYCPTNYFGNPVPAGCVAIAIGQIFSVHEYPTCWTLTYESGNPTINVNWSVLKNQSSCGSCRWWQLCSDHNPIAQIIRQIGEDVEMDYYPTGSRAEYGNEQIAFNKYGYTSDYYEDYNFNSVKTSLSNGRPLFMIGYETVNESGHAWVIDGCREVFYTHYTYSKPHGSPNSAWTFEGSYTETIRLNHINWGEEGDCNGYFSSECFNTQHGVYDVGCNHHGNANFTIYLQIRPNIRKL